MTTPSITVLIAVYNAERYISACIESILQQSHTDFELLILDDGSSDNSAKIIGSYRDERIQYIKCEHDYIATLNRGLRLAKGKYIARMDADDLMHPDRLRIQYSVMEAAPEVDLCSSWMQLFNTNKRGSRTLQSLAGLIDNPQLDLLERNFVSHPSVMLRKSFLKGQKLSYSTHFPYAEDYKLWVDMALSGAIFYIEPEPLVYYRVHDEQVSQVHLREQGVSQLRLRQELLAHLLQAERYAPLSKLYSEVQSLVSQGQLGEEEALNLFIPFIRRYNNHAPLERR